jgi:basic membrane protein A
MTVTSAMKGLYPTTVDTLTDVVINGKWDNYKGKIVTLGMVSEKAELNYVQLGATQFAEGKFTEADYATLVKAIFDKTIVVSNDIGAMPAVTNTTIDDQGNLK